MNKTGIIQGINRQQRSGKKGPFITIGVMIDKEWYNMIQNEMSATWNKGDEVSFDWEKDQYGNKIKFIRDNRPAQVNPGMQQPMPEPRQEVIDAIQDAVSLLTINEKLDRIMSMIDGKLTI